MSSTKEGIWGKKASGGCRHYGCLASLHSQCPPWAHTIPKGSRGFTPISTGALKHAVEK